ncbi:MAG TPA: 4Fe-4S dicluster domain-containing protein [Anaeromyxobacter sp.]
MIPPRPQAIRRSQRAGGEPEGGPAPAGRIGLYFCRCGPNLGNVVRIGELEDPSGWPGLGDVATHSILCSGEGKAWLAQRIRERGLERVVVAACSPREHELTFRGVLASEGRSPFHLQMVNLREQVEWIGGSAEEATRRSRQLVQASLRRVALQRDLPAQDVEVSADVLVVGGGAAGISAALALAGKDRHVIVADREFVVGGLANQLDEIFPDLECASCFMEPALDRLLHSDRIEVLTGAEVTRVRGAEGRFEVELALRPRGVDPTACLGCDECGKACPVQIPDRFAGGLSTRKAIGLPYAGCLPHASVLDAAACVRARGEACDLCAKACAFGAVRFDEPPRARTARVGAIVLATGMRPGELAGPDGLVSSYQLERMLHPNGPTAGVLRGARGKEPRSVLIGTTASVEDGDLAAEEILKLAHVVRAKLPSAKVALAGGLENVPRLARRAAALAAEGVELVPGEIVLEGVAAAGEGVAVRIARGGSRTVRTADLVVVHAPTRPAEGADALARLLRIGKGEGGFLLDQAVSPFEPTATRIAGVYVAGAAAGPRSIPQAIRDGKAAAGLVLASLVAGERRALEPLAAEIDEALCGGCGICASSCPFGAVQVAERDAARKARVEAIHCRGCGICAAACPTGAASARHFTRAQISAEISALLGSPGPAVPRDAIVETASFRDATPAANERADALSATGHG